MGSGIRFQASGRGRRFLGHAAAWLTVVGLLLPLSNLALAQDAQASPQQSCPDRLRFLYQTLTKYAREHDGALPSRLSVLYTDKYIPFELWAFWCPEDTNGNRTEAGIDPTGSYELVAKRLDAASEAPLLRERICRHAGGEGNPNYGHQLGQNGTVARFTDAPVVNNCPTEPPTVRFVGTPRQEWSTLDGVHFEWEGKAGKDSPGRLEYQCNFTRTGLGQWQTESAISLGRLPQGDSYRLQVRARDGQCVSDFQDVAFRVLPGNRVRVIDFWDRYRRPTSKSPQGDPAKPVWHRESGALLKVEIRGENLSETASEAQESEGVKPGSKRGGNRGSASGRTKGQGKDKEEKDDQDDIFGSGANQDRPEIFMPRVPHRKHLVLERPFNLFRITLYFDSDSDDQDRSFRCELFRDGKSVLNPKAVPATSRLYDVLIPAAAAYWPTGRYCFSVSNEAGKVCDLYFNVGNARVAARDRQEMSDELELAEFVSKTPAVRVPVRGLGAELDAPRLVPTMQPVETPKPATSSPQVSQPKPAVSGTGSVKPVETPKPPPSKPTWKPVGPKSSKYLLP